MRFAVSFVVLIGVSACTDFPQLDAVISDHARTADYPKILPLDTLLAGVPPADADFGLGNLAVRAARLRARAAILRGQVVDNATRARLAAAVARYSR